MLNIMQKRLMIQKILTLPAFYITIKSTPQTDLMHTTKKAGGKLYEKIMAYRQYVCDGGLLYRWRGFV